MKYIFVFALVILFGCQKNSKDYRAEAIDKFVSSQAKHFRFNGSVLVAEKGKVIYQKNFGISDYNTSQPLDDNTMYELASVSKQFTASAILLLKEKGQLVLADTLRKFFPELPYSGITLHHLLTHTSGVPDYESTMTGKWDENKIAFNPDMIKFLASEKPPIHFLPGKRWEYSNTGFALLASVVEKVSGQSFKDFMSVNFFQPLNMTRSRVYNTRRSGEVIDNYAYGYIWSDSLKKNLLPDSMANMKFVYWLDGIQGDGIINSTVSDLLKWDRAIVEHKILSEATINEQTTYHAMADTTSKYYYGYGVSVGANQFGKFIAHSGGWPGYATNLSRYIDQDLTIIVLSNNQSASPAISGSIAHILFNDPVLDAYEHTAVPPDSATLNSFSGKFKIKNGEIQIVNDKGQLYRQHRPNTRTQLFIESPTVVFQGDGFDVQYHVATEPGGKKKYYRIFYGVKEEMEKIELN
jgi:CubicO group peptidase (beta-lactamase class C family)